MSSIEAFKSAILRIRDILRSPGVSITGMDSLRHVCLYIVSRYMTREMVRSLGIAEEFCWESLIDNIRNKKDGLQLALNYFYHLDDDCLFKNFVNIFDTTKFTFEVKDIQSHAEILQILDKINMYEVDCQMDILGWVYEQYLKVGASSTGRDLSQYFTTRQICEYMTQLCQPGFKETGVPETVLDPTMGTGGFLTSYIKFYKKKYPDIPIDWSFHTDKIHGYDIDPLVSSLAQMNLFIEMNGHRASNLKCHDSLYGDVDQISYDIILANMPFGLKGLKHAQCCPRIKKLKINGNASEPLFLQLMMTSLNHGGRCAVVVPDGMLVNSQKIHIGTREYLLKHFNLKRVIKMKGKFFTNTDVEPSILLFEAIGTPTQNIEFSEVSRNASDELTEKVILTLPRQELDLNFSLDVRKYQKEENFSSDGYSSINLGDYIKILSGKRRTLEESKENGKYTFVTCSILGTSKIDVADFTKEAIIINAINGSGKCRPYYCEEYSTTSNNIHFTINEGVEDQISLRFVHRYLELKPGLLEAGFFGGNQKKISQDFIRTIKIILPPRPIQDEIVATLDRFYQPGTEIADTLKLTNRAMDLVLMKPDGSTLEPIIEIQRLIKSSSEMTKSIRNQMEALVKSLEYYGFERHSLSEICNCKNGTVLSKEQKIQGGEYPVMGGGMNYVGSFSQYNREGINISISKSGSSSGFVKYHDQKFWAGDCLTLSPKDERVSFKYLYFFLKMNEENLTKSVTTGTTIPHCKWDDIKDLIITVPPPDFQNEIISILEDLESDQRNLANLIEKSQRNAQLILRPILSVQITSQPEDTLRNLSQAPTPNASITTPEPSANASAPSVDVSASHPRSRGLRINIVN
jgi:type I restriction-modification system DNA methylase subunit/restriction endonuclease S subunit